MGLKIVEMFKKLSEKYDKEIAMELELMQDVAEYQDSVTNDDGGTFYKKKSGGEVLYGVTV